MVATDDLDEALLRLLKRNARSSFVELAKDLSTSEGTVRARLKKLVDAGIIKQFTIRAAGKAVKALVSVNVAPTVGTHEVSDAISKLEGVSDVWEVSGDEDVLVRVDVSTTEELDDVVERIRRVSHVGATRSRLILREC